MKKLKELDLKLELGNVLNKCSYEHNWESDKAEYAKEWYLKHWFICDKYPDEPISAISAAADELWHQHIVDTQKYEKDSKDILGTYMHHKPIYGEPDADELKAYERTKELYLKEFGTLPTDMRMTSHRGLSYALPRI